MFRKTTLICLFLLIFEAAYLKSLACLQPIFAADNGEDLVVDSDLVYDTTVSPAPETGQVLNAETTTVQEVSEDGQTDTLQMQPISPSESVQSANIDSGDDNNDNSQDLSDVTPTDQTGNANSNNSDNNSDSSDQ